MTTPRLTRRRRRFFRRFIGLATYANPSTSVSGCCASCAVNRSGWLGNGRAIRAGLSSWPASQLLPDRGCGSGWLGAFSGNAEDLLAAVARLPEHERIVIVLRYVDGRSVAEVAAALGRPIGTVTKQLSRAIERLKNKTKGVTG